MKNENKMNVIFLITFMRAGAIHGKLMNWSAVNNVNAALFILKEHDSSFFQDTNSSSSPVGSENNFCVKVKKFQLKMVENV